jgi:hypothetical protein
MHRRASRGLEASIDESNRVSVGARHHPTILQGMRYRHGTVEAIERLMRGGEIQTGFKKLKALGLLDWSIEAAVMKFKTEFTNAARECAEFRLRLARDEE